jgi:hypothetical protein
VFRPAFYLLWFSACLLQAGATELLGDEAYYWAYSRALAWGYFDHPPVIALMIRAGTALFSGEWGVRLLSALASTLTLGLLEALLRPARPLLYYTLAASVGILHFVGFMAIPDSPLLLFAALFLLLYREYCHKPGYVWALALGLCGAAMLMSKYHAVLIIGLVVLSRPALLGQFRFWVAAATTTVLMLPHVLWQAANDYPTLSYHLVERSTQPYTFAQTLEYLLGQLVVLGPFSGLFFFLAAWRYRPRDAPERALKTLFWGGYAFFLLMSFKGRVEAHWTLFTVLPGLYFGYHYLAEKPHGQRVAGWLAACSLPLILAGRLLMAFDWQGAGIGTEASWARELRSEYHGKRAWTSAVQQVAGERPVAFMNSYQRASLYQFYTGAPAFSLNNTLGRRNQYDLWGSAENWRGAEVVLVPNYDKQDYALVPGAHPPLRWGVLDRFPSYAPLRLRAAEALPEVAPGDTLRIRVQADYPSWLRLNDPEAPDYPPLPVLQYFSGKRQVREQRIALEAWPEPGQTMEWVFAAPEQAGTYGVFFSARAGWLPGGFHSRRYALVVKQRASP